MSQSKPPGFQIMKDKIVFDSGKSVSFRFPVAEAIGFDNAVVVRLDIPRGQRLNENVYGADYEGNVLWQVAPQIYVSDDSPYTKIARKDSQVWLANWDGLELTVDPDTGHILNKFYGK